MMDVRESCGLGSSGSGQGQLADSCEHGNGPLGCLKGGEFIL
jgi:hypothetical protein